MTSRLKPVLLKIMILEFTKMQGLGNDFVVFDATKRPLELTPEQYRFIADRHFGIGCDQILLVEPPRDTGNAFHYRIYNADGGEVEQCGNGARCFARFVRDHNLTDRDEIRVGTRAGPITLYIEKNNHVRVDMGEPLLEPADIPLAVERREELYSLTITGEEILFGAVSMGNPHAIVQVDNTAQADVERLGPLIESHPLFPRRTNVGFMEVRSPEHIFLRVFERGTGETLACGTGACAAVVFGRIRGLLGERVRVTLPGGDLMIKWAGQGHTVWMSGPATRVYDGRIRL